MPTCQFVCTHLQGKVGAKQRAGTGRNWSERMRRLTMTTLALISKSKHIELTRQCGVVRKPPAMEEYVVGTVQFSAQITFSPYTLPDQLSWACRSWNGRTTVLAGRPALTDGPGVHTIAGGLSHSPTWAGEGPFNARGNPCSRSAGLHMAPTIWMGTSTLRLAKQTRAKNHGRLRYGPPVDALMAERSRSKAGPSAWIP